MADESKAGRFVGPVMRAGDVADAVLDAIREDNVGREVNVEEHASYLRIKVRGECVLKFDTVGEMLGREVSRGDIESCMPAFEGFIRVDADGMRFLAS